MWLKKEYGIYINPNDKAFIYSIRTRNDKLYSNEFKIVPFGIAAVLKLIGNGWELNAVVENLIGCGMEKNKAQNLVQDIVKQYHYLFSEIQPEELHNEKQLNEMIAQFGKMPFDYRHKKYSFPKNVILEVTADGDRYMKFDIAKRIHTNCYEGGTENIFYLGTNVSQWDYLPMFIKENHNRHICSVLNTDLSEEPTRLQQMIECGIDRLQILCKDINCNFWDNLQMILSFKISFDLFLFDDYTDTLTQFPFEKCKNLLRNTYVHNDSIKKLGNMIQVLKNVGIQPIILSDCKKTMFGQRSCFKSGVMNLTFTADGKAVFCITGGRHIVLGDVATDTVQNIWNNFDSSVENRKSVFSKCSINS